MATLSASFLSSDVTLVKGSVPVQTPEAAGHQSEAFFQEHATLLYCGMYTFISLVMAVSCLGIWLYARGL